MTTNENTVAVIGIDPSSKKIAVTVTIDDEPKITMRTKPLPRDITDVCLVAFLWTRSMVKEFVNEGHKVYVFIEEPVVGRGGAYATIRQSKAHGAMVAGAATVSGAKVHTVNNKRWKKVVLGNGNMGKPQIKTEMRTIWRNAYDLSGGDGDLIDSAAINRYGVKTLKIEGSIATKKTATIIRKVRRGNS